MSVSKCVGIDLGTTNSVIAMLGDDNKTIICRTDKVGRKTFPSVVVYDKKTNGLKAGQAAFNKRGTIPEPIVSIKSHMGDANYRASTGPVTMSPIEVSAEILREMKEQMEDYLHTFPEYKDYVVDRAVITVPAYFASNAREATTKAGELAGLKVEFTLQEPTAAALYYCKKNEIENGIFMVYDLGGGTFDVSIVRINEGDAYVLGIAGNNYLGGDNFDGALAKMLLQQLQDSDEGYELDDMDINNNEDDRRRFTRLKLSAEIIKKALSSHDEYYENTDGVFDDKCGAKVNLAADVSREEFEELIRPLLQSTIPECEKALAEAEKKGVTLDMIDGVLLVGGSTHIPVVAEIIEETFTSPSLPHHTKAAKPFIDEPDMAVGYGAAIAAASAGSVVMGEASSSSACVVSASFECGIGYGGTSNVAGKLTAVKGKLPDGIYARVSRALGGFKKEYMVDEDGSFTFEDLTAEEEKEPYSCEFIAGGETILKAEFDAAPTGGGEIPVVLSRNYYIKTMDKLTGQVKMLKLMEKGAALPCTKEYTLHTNKDNPYFVALEFYEEDSLLKSSRFEFETQLPPDTPINLSISFDRASILSFRAEANGNIIEGNVEPAPPPQLPDPIEARKVIETVRAQIKQIPEAGKRIVAETQLNRLAASFQEAMDANDPYMAKDILGKIKSLNVPVSNELTPGKKEFDNKVAGLFELNAQSEKGSAEIADEIREAQAEGYRAYENEDQAALTNADKELDNIKEMLEKDDDGPGSGQPPMWQVCYVFSMKVNEMIDTYSGKKAEGKVPRNVARDYDSYVQPDKKDCNAIMAACRFMPNDNDCMTYLNTLRDVYPRWEKCMKLIGVDGYPSLPEI